jgi:shikimate kinase
VRQLGQGIVLIGPPTAGKSSVGALLATALGVPFADTVASGLDAIRPDGGVLAVGSGAVLDPDVRRMLVGQVIVYLEAEFATVAKRTGMDRPRVVIPGNPRGQLRAMLEERRPVYADLATFIVPTDDLAPEEVAADLAKRLRS